MVWDTPHGCVCVLVIAVIAATLFPLWPAEMRVGVYYLSVCAGCFVASILLLAVGEAVTPVHEHVYNALLLFLSDWAAMSPSFSLSAARCILFLIIWLVTGGRHHFWFLPNLTADVGFVDSFRPIYTHEYKGPRTSGKKGTGEKSEGKGTKTQKSDSEDKSDGEKKEEEEEEVEEEEEEEAGKEAERRSDSDSERREDEGSQHSNGNDFEMITRDELEQHTEEEEEEEEGQEGK